MFCRRRVSYKNKAVLITGCDSGFGNQLALKLNEMGYRVYATVLDLDSTGAIELSSKCKFDKQMIVLQMNVTNDEQIDQCFERVRTDLIRDSYNLWSVVNNARVHTLGHLEWGGFDEYKQVFDVNVFGVARVTRRFIPLIRIAQGRIVIVASLAGRTNLMNLGIYSMSNSALLSFAASLRNEMNKFNVNVCTIELGIYRNILNKSSADNEAQFWKLEMAWSQTDDAVRQIYGETYFNENRELIEKYFNLFSGSTNVKLQEAMIHATTSRNPRSCYQPVNTILSRMLVWLLPITPQCFIDQMQYYLDNSKPDFMKKS